MKIYSIPFEPISQHGKRFSSLFVDYTSSSEKSDNLGNTFFSGHFRSEQSQSEKLALLEQRANDREALVKLLHRQNQRFNPSENTRTNIDQLLSSNTVAVVTGQQVGMFSGSLYTIYKTASCISLVKRFKKQFPNYHFVPLFWLEGEDHDYEEVSSSTVFFENVLKSFHYEEKNRLDRKMVGRTIFSDGITAFVNDFLSALPATDFKESITHQLHFAYKPGSTFLSAFASIMGYLFKDEGLIFLSADDPQVKQLVKPIFLKEFETHPKSSELVISQSALIEDSGYDVQAKPKPINFYFLDSLGKRLNIESFDEKYVNLKPSRDIMLKTTLLDLVHNHPESLSPNVILRPLVQDFLLPTFAYVAGPGEVAYWAQLKLAYEFFGVEMPLVIPRASLTLVESKISKVIEKLGGERKPETYELFFANKELLINTYVGANMSLDLEALFSEVEKEIANTIEKLSNTLPEVDPSLAQTLETSRGKMFFQLAQLKEKAFRAEKQKQSEFLSQMEKCSVNLLPNGKLQEREINVLYFINKYGNEFMTLLQEAIDNSDWREHLIVEL